MSIEEVLLVTEAILNFLKTSLISMIKSEIVFFILLQKFVF